MNDIIAHMAPPITCVFVLGVFWPAASARSAKWTMWLGSHHGSRGFRHQNPPCLETRHLRLDTAFLYEPRS